MTSPSAERDLLMCCASRSRLPSAPDRPTRSEPARSTRFSFPEGTHSQTPAGISAQSQHLGDAVAQTCCVAPTCGAEPRAAVEAADSDDEKGMGAGAVLVQVGALCCPVDVAELKDLVGSTARWWGKTSLPQIHHNPSMIWRTPGTWPKQQPPTRCLVHQGDGCCQVSGWVTH